MLSKRYIKYTSEITREIFEKIWNKLIDSGWECGDDNLNDCYKDFCGSYPYIVDDSEYFPKKFIAYDCTSDNFMKDHKEISYKEFLNDIGLSAYSNQDLIAHAKKEYPVGTKIISVVSGDTFIITSDNFVIDGSGDVMGDSDRSRTPIIYSKKQNKWSTIIDSDLLAEARLKYTAGVVCKSTFSNSIITIRQDDELTLQKSGDISNKDGYIIYNATKSNWAEIFSKPLETSKHIFKVGDTVRVTEMHSNNTSRSVGYIGKLTRADDSKVPYEVDGVWCKNVELIEIKATREWWRDLKNGDFVVSLNDCDRMRTKNFIYKIQDISNPVTGIRYIRNNGSQGGTSNTEDFRLATPEEILMYKKDNKPCDVTKKPILPTDQELLDYANKHFIVGTKFISNIKPDRNLERTCEYYSSSQTSFNWRISVVDGVRAVYCLNGMSNSKGGCSNPYIYTDELGWNRITYDASTISDSIDPRKTCVEITTQVEWNAVMDVVRSGGGKYNSFNEYSSIRIGCIVLSDGCHSPKSYFIKKGYTILTFKEWCNRNSINIVMVEPKRQRPNDLNAFRVGDSVMYCEETTRIVALSYDHHRYIVEYSKGWSKGTTKVDEGELNSTKLYHFVDEGTLLSNQHNIPRKSAVVTPSVIDDLKCISSTLDIPIKRRSRSSQKPKELKFSNN